MVTPATSASRGRPAARARLEVKHDARTDADRPVRLQVHRAAGRPTTCAPSTRGNCPTLTTGLKIKTTIDLHDQAGAGVDQRPRVAVRGGRSPRRRRGLASVNASNGHIQAIATSGDYAQTKVNYATSAMRQTGSAFKVFALMELIHDYEGDPNTPTTLQAAGGRLDVAGPDVVGPHRRLRLQRLDQHHEATWLSDNTVFAQLSPTWAWRSSTRSPTRWASPRRSPATRRRCSAASPTAPRRCRWPTPTRRSPTAASTTRRRSSTRSSSRTGRCGLRQLQGPPRLLLRRDLRGRSGPQAGAHPSRARPARGLLGLPGRRQDRHRREPGERLVRRLHAADLDRGLGRQPAGQRGDNDGFGGTLAAPVWKQYMERARRLLRRLDRPHRAVHRDRVHRPALVSAPPPSTGRQEEPREDRRGDDRHRRRQHRHRRGRHDRATGRRGNTGTGRRRTGGTGTTGGASPTG